MPETRYCYTHPEHGPLYTPRCLEVLISSLLFSLSLISFAIAIADDWSSGAQYTIFLITGASMSFWMICLWRLFHDSSNNQVHPQVEN